MNLKDRFNIQIAFNQYTRLIEKAGHGENEVERETLVAKANELATPWQAEQYTEDWRYLHDLREQWREDPDRMRAEAKAALAGRSRFDEVDEATDRRNSHISYVQHFYDPREQERWDWREMHNKISMLHGHLAASRSTVMADDIQARINVLEDRSTWPESWHEFEAEIAEDYEWSMDQSALASEYYELVVRGREEGPGSVPIEATDLDAIVPAPPATEHEEETETEVEDMELEESSWGA